MKKTTLLLSNILIFFSICNGQISLVKDINTNVNPATSSYSQYYDTLGQYIYFSATDSLDNIELWKTDGTEANTSIAADIIPGIEGSCPENIKSINGSLYFTVYTTNKGRELYKSDGTANGTSIVSDINPGPNSSKVKELTAAQGSIYFIANDGVHGDELWITNDTMTNMVEDITIGSSSSEIKNLTYSGSYLYFTIGNKLYRTAGDSSSTILLHNFGSNELQELTDYNGTLYFTVSEILMKIWKSNGTVAGTQLYSNKTSHNLLVFNNYLYFLSSTAYYTSSKLYKTNGSAAPVLVKDLGLTRYDRKVIVTSNKFYFFLNATLANNCQLVESDGTTTGTKTAGSSINRSDLEYVFGINGSLIYLIKNHFFSSYQLYKYDDSTSTVSQISSNTRSPNSALYIKGIQLGNKFVFSFGDASCGLEPFVYDDDSLSFSMIKNIRTGTKGSSNLNFTTLTRLNNKLYFSAKENNDNNIWYSDGTSSGTKIIPYTNVNNVTSYPLNPKFITSVNNSIFFFSGSNLYKTTGAEDTSCTKLYTNLSNPFYFGKFNNKPIIGYDNKISILDNTDNTHTLVANCNYLHYNNHYYADDILYTQNGIYINGNNGLYYSDGSYSLATKLIGGDIQAMASDGNIAYFIYENYDTLKLYKTTGTVNSTILIKDFGKQPSQHIIDICVIDSLLFFPLKTSINGNEMWVSNGTSSGTSIIKDIKIGNQSSFQECSMHRINNKLVFIANDGIRGCEPWITDGTNQGTHILKDITVGSDGSFSSLNTKFKYNYNKLFISNSKDVYITDGTSINTRKLSDNMETKFPSRINSEDIYIISKYANNSFYTGHQSISIYNPLTDSLHYLNAFTDFHTSTSINRLDTSLYFFSDNSFGYLNQLGNELHRFDYNNIYDIKLKDTSVCRTIKIGYFANELMNLNNGISFYISDSTGDFSNALYIGKSPINKHYGYHNYTFDSNFVSSLNYKVKAVFSSGKEIITSFIKNDPVLSNLNLVQNSFCEGDSSVLLSGGSPLNGIYSGSKVHNDILSIDSLTPGTYPIYYTISNDFCSDTDSNNITIIAKPSTSIDSFPNTICEGSPSFPLYASPINGLFSGLGISGDSLIPNLYNSGTHYITYSFIDTNTSCSSTDTAFFSLIATPVVHISSNIDSICNSSDPILLSASPSNGNFYGIGIGIGNDSLFPSLCPIGYNTYVYNYTDSNNCSSSDSSSFYIIPNPLVTINTQLSTLCDNSSPILLVGSPINGTFSGNGVVGDSLLPSISNLGNNIVTYSFTDSNNCTSSDTINFYINQAPIVNINNSFDSICNNSSPIYLIGSPTNGVFSGMGVFGDSLYPFNCNIGNNNISYIFSDSNNCTNSISKDFFILQSPYVFIGEDTILCGSQSITLNSGYNSGILWSTNSNMPSITIDSLNIGYNSINISCQITNSSNCTNSDTIQITFVNCNSINTIANSEFNIFPNPTKGDIFIEFNSRNKGNYIVILTDINGNIVYKSEKYIDIHNSRFSIHTNLSKGIYNLTISNEEEMVQKKVIIY